MTLAAQPSVEYLLSASTTSLESLQLSRLAQIAALKSQIHEALEAWATAEMDVRLTRFILETRVVLADPPLTSAAPLDRAALFALLHSAHLPTLLQSRAPSHHLSPRASEIKSLSPLAVLRSIVPRPSTRCPPPPRLAHAALPSATQPCPTPPICSLAPHPAL
jgi:hypothetical protein